MVVLVVFKDVTAVYNILSVVVSSVQVFGSNFEIAPHLPAY